MKGGFELEERGLVEIKVSYEIYLYINMFIRVFIKLPRYYYKYSKLFYLVFTGKGRDANLLVVRFGQNGERRKEGLIEMKEYHLKIIK